MKLNNKRKEMITLLQGMKDGKISLDVLEPNKVHIFIQYTDRPGVYILDDSTQKEFTEAEYQAFCEKVRNKRNGSIIWNEVRPAIDIIIVKNYEKDEIE